VNARQQLVILRHGKAMAATAGGLDHGRPLAERGVAEVPRVAARLAELGWEPDEVFCSDALRTTETLHHADRVWRLDDEPHITRRLYLASAQRIGEVLRHATGQTVAVVGHNPGLEELVQLLAGTSVRLTTANAALLWRPPAPWSRSFEPDGWSLVDVIRPADL
jgi:phosphohistidine phosphatase